MDNKPTVESTTTAGTSLRAVPELHQLIDEVKGLLDTAAEAGERQLDPLRQRLGRQLRELRLQLSDLEDAGRLQVRHAVRHTDATVQAHPYRAIGVAAVAGLLIGWLASRR